VLSSFVSSVSHFSNRIENLDGLSHVLDPSMHFLVYNPNRAIIVVIFGRNAYSLAYKPTYRSQCRLLLFKTFISSNLLLIFLGFFEFIPSALFVVTVSIHIVEMILGFLASDFAILQLLLTRPYFWVNLVSYTLSAVLLSALLSWDVRSMIIPMFVLEGALDSTIAAWPNFTRSNLAVLPNFQICTPFF